MIEKSFFLEAFDGRKMFFNQWTSHTPAKASLVLIHGMGEHSGRYRHFAEYFTGNGVNVYAVDLFGHGRTEGTKGHTPRIDDYLWQVDFLVGMIGQLGLPLFIYGHSMGGGVVLNYLFKKNPRVAGVIVSAPAIEPGFEISRSRMTVGRIGRKLFPSLTQKNGLDVNGISRDPAVINAYHADPLVHDVISAEVGMGVLDWGRWLVNLQRDAVAVSLLIMHGDKDMLTNPDASRKFAAKFMSGDVTFRLWKDFFHELHNEPGKEEVFRYVLNWIMARL
ncbi:lysophospholipase [Leadbetterella sp. DM7]|uniref:alpha/beta hydrolase n=1 Tax=Leadbetterella sp. DM7 TaxID=3235085 RepID=UPI00349ED264